MSTIETRHRSGKSASQWSHILDGGGALKMTDMKMTDQIAGLQGMKMQDMKLQDTTRIDSILFNFSFFLVL